MEFLVIFLLTVLNGIFSLSEIALFASRRTKLEEMSRKKKLTAKAALVLLDKPEQFLSTVQIGITLIGTISGAYGGLSLAGELEQLLLSWGVQDPNIHAISVSIAIGLITYLSIIIGELVPKTIALSNPEGLSCFFAWPMRILLIILSPIVWFLSASTKAVLWVLRVKERTDSAASADELKVMVEQSSRAGQIDEDHSTMLKNMFKFSDRRVSAIMESRSEMVWLDITDPEGINREKILATGYSWYAVCDGDIDKVKGILVLSDYLRNIDGGTGMVQRSVRPPLVLLENLTALEVLEAFKQNHTHAAIIINEYGSVEGFVTLDALIDSLIGEVPEHPGEKIEKLLIEEDETHVVLDGRFLLDELFEKFPDLSDLKQNRDYDTLAGLFMDLHGKIPEPGAIITFSGYRFTVIKMQKTRVAEVRIDLPEPEKNEEDKHQKTI